MPRDERFTQTAARRRTGGAHPQPAPHFRRAPRRPYLRRPRGRSPRSTASTSTSRRVRRWPSSARADRVSRPCCASSPGWSKPTSGSVTLTGTGGPQMVFQDAGSSLTPWMSVGETLAERLRPLSWTARDVRERVTAALAAVACRRGRRGPPRRTVRRAAATRRAGPRHHHPARGAAVRRAHQRAGRVAGQERAGTSSGTCARGSG